MWAFIRSCSCFKLNIKPFYHGKTYDTIKGNLGSVSFVLNTAVRMAGEKCASDNQQDCTDDDSVVETCIFCQIANREDPYTEILAEDEDIVCFEDIDPGAPHHYLVIPKKHIYSCLSLQANDININLVKKMADMGRDVLKAKNVTNLEDISLGFHVPPYITVPHLHLHVLAPFSQLFKWTECKYTAFWYITEEKMLQELKKEKKKRKGHNCKLKGVAM
ncbi:adenosine 5'-monophosphoramidase HINT3 [Garra rufa]|uniref:adenosine 5'-monophosphoramidase HINT3 n=1 Tax=Garra rufa TaxID=137080 RepID=UPI003CCE5451